MIFLNVTGGVLIREYVGLRPKMYSILLDNNKSIKRATGVKKHALEKEIIYENYLEVLSKKKTLHHRMNVIQSSGHRLYTTRVYKQSLSLYI